MKKNRRKTSGYRPYPPYDPQMIKDFIEQLEWGLRTSHFEYVSKRGPLNEGGYMDRPISPDLVSQLATFAKKRGCLSLITVPVVDPCEAEALSPDDRKRAGDLLDALLAQEAEHDLKMLEALKRRLQEALACVSNPSEEICRQYSLSKVLKEHGEGHGEHAE